MTDERKEPRRAARETGARLHVQDGQYWIFDGDPDAGFVLSDPGGSNGLPRTLVTAPRGGPRNVSQQHMAVPALWGAAEQDPLAAAIDALFAAAVTFGGDYRALLDEVRRAFPAIRSA